MLVLRALRVLRILKLTKHMKALKELAQRAFGSPAGVMYAFLVTISFIFLLALFGNQLFRSSMTFAVARNDFQYIMEAMQALIENLFGDHYFDDIDAGFEAANFVGILFFVSYYYIGNFVVLRIFIAIILENFEYAEEKRICMQIQLYQRHQIKSNDLIDGRWATRFSPSLFHGMLVLHARNHSEAVIIWLAELVRFRFKKLSIV